MSKLKLLIVFAVGYVAGAAAGRQRYETIKSSARKLATDPRVRVTARRAGKSAAEKASGVAEVVKNTTVSATSAISDKWTSDDRAEEPRPAARAHGATSMS
jgi:hypothetical protein